VQQLDSFPAFYGTRKFIIVFTRALNLYLFWARPIQSTPTKPIFTRSNLMLSIHLRLGLPIVTFLLAFVTIIYKRSSSPHSCYMPRPSHPPRQSTYRITDIFYTWFKILRKIYFYLFYCFLCNSNGWSLWTFVINLNFMFKDWNIVREHTKIKIIWKGT
jgi:hypothetical protein